jgi:hypothetical protein
VMRMTWAIENDSEIKNTNIWLLLKLVKWVRFSFMFYIIKPLFRMLFRFLFWVTIASLTVLWNKTLNSFKWLKTFAEKYTSFCDQYLPKFDKGGGSGMSNSNNTSTTLNQSPPFSYREWIDSIQIKWPWDQANNYLENLNNINDRFNFHIPSLNQVGVFCLYAAISVFAVAVLLDVFNVSWHRESHIAGNLVSKSLDVLYYVPKKMWKGFLYLTGRNKPDNLSPLQPEPPLHSTPAEPKSWFYRVWFRNIPETSTDSSTKVPIIKTPRFKARLKTNYTPENPNIPPSSPIQKSPIGLSGSGSRSAWFDHRISRKPKDFSLETITELDIDDPWPPWD